MDQAVERRQRGHQEHVPPVVRVTEVRPVGYLEGRDQCDEPAASDRDPCRIRHDVRVGPDGRRKPVGYGSHVSLQQVESPGPGSRTWLRSAIPERIHPPIAAWCFRCLPLAIYISCPAATRAQCTSPNRQSAASRKWAKDKGYFSMFIYRSTGANATLLGGMGGRRGRVRLASARRIDVPENVGGPASCGNAERLGPHQGLRPLARPTGAGAPLSLEDMSPGTRETDHGAGGEAGDRGLPQAPAAPTANTMHEGENRP